MIHPDKWIRNDNPIVGGHIYSKVRFLLKKFERTEDIMQATPVETLWRELVFNSSWATEKKLRRTRADIILQAKHLHLPIWVAKKKRSVMMIGVRMCFKSTKANDNER